MAAGVARRGGRALRVLCLHGMYQSGQVFATKTLPLRQQSEALAEFVFVDAPFCVTPPIMLERAGTTRAGGLHAQNARHPERPASIRHPPGSRTLRSPAQFRAWWRPKWGLQEPYACIDQERSVVVDFLKHQLDGAEFDGILGFSQGATLASWMCTPQACKLLGWSPEFVVVVGGYIGPPQFSIANGVLGDIDSLHMFGNNDFVISASKSEQVLDQFQTATHIPHQVHAFRHDQGHVVPKSLDAQQTLHTFLLAAQTRLRHVAA